MGHFSMEKSLNPGSALSGNQQLASPMPPFTPDMTPDAKAVVAPLQLNFEAPQTEDTTQP